VILPSVSPLREVNAVMENVQLKEKSAHTSILHQDHFITGLLEVVRRWVGRVARMRGGEVYTGFWWGDLRE